MAEKPTAAFVLSLIGAIFILINSIIIAIAGAFIALFLPGIGAAIAIIGLIIGIIALVGAIMINSTEPGKVKTGGIIVLIFSIISLIIGGGFFIGFLLGLIGGILALTWKPPAKPVEVKETPPSPPPPPPPA